jgi:hypothetical protein
MNPEWSIFHDMLKHQNWGRPHTILSITQTTTSTPHSTHGGHTQCHQDADGVLRETLRQIPPHKTKKFFSCWIKILLSSRYWILDIFNFSRNILILLTELKRFQKAVLNDALFLVSHIYIMWETKKIRIIESSPKLLRSCDCEVYNFYISILYY